MSRQQRVKMSNNKARVEGSCQGKHTIQVKYTTASIQCVGGGGFREVFVLGVPKYW
jgi:hypothetical protein